MAANGQVGAEHLGQDASIHGQAGGEHPQQDVAASGQASDAHSGNYTSEQVGDGYQDHNTSTGQAGDQYPQFDTAATQVGYGYQDHNTSTGQAGDQHPQFDSAYAQTGDTRFGHNASSGQAGDVHPDPLAASTQANEGYTPLDHTPWQWTEEHTTLDHTPWQQAFAYTGEGDSAHSHGHTGDNQSGHHRHSDEQADDDHVGQHNHSGASANDQHVSVDPTPWQWTEEHTPLDHTPWQWTEGHTLLDHTPWQWTEGHTPLDHTPWQWVEEHTPTNHNGRQPSEQHTPLDHTPWQWAEGHTPLDHTPWHYFGIHQEQHHTDWHYLGADNEHGHADWHLMDMHSGGHPMFAASAEYLNTHRAHHEHNGQARHSHPPTQTQVAVASSDLTHQVYPPELSPKTVRQAPKPSHEPVPSGADVSSDQVPGRETQGQGHTDGKTPTYSSKIDQVVQEGSVSIRDFVDPSGHELPYASAAGPNPAHWVQTPDPKAVSEVPKTDYEHTPAAIISESSAQIPETGNLGSFLAVQAHDIQAQDSPSILSSLEHVYEEVKQELTRAETFISEKEKQLEQVLTAEMAPLHETFREFEQQVASEGAMFINQTAGIPLVEDIARSYAEVVMQASQAPEAALKLGEDSVQGAAHTLLHPVNTALDIEAVLEHSQTEISTPLRVLHGAYNALVEGKDLRDIANHMLNPYRIAQDDTQFWEHFVQNMLQPYAEAGKHYRYGELLTRAVLEFVVLPKAIGGVEKTVASALQELKGVSTLATRGTEVANNVSSVLSEEVPSVGTGTWELEGASTVRAELAANGGGSPNRPPGEMSSQAPAPSTAPEAQPQTEPVQGGTAPEPQLPANSPETVGSPDSLANGGPAAALPTSPTADVTALSIEPAVASPADVAAPPSTHEANAAPAEQMYEGVGSQGTQAQAGEHHPAMPSRGEVGHVAPYNKQPAALYEANGERITENEHIMPRGNLEALTFDPETSVSDYGDREYRNDATVLVEREMALNKTHGNRGGDLADNPSTSRLEAAIEDGQPINYREDVFLERIENAKHARDATNSAVTDEAINRGALTQDGNLFDTYDLQEAGRRVESKGYAVEDIDWDCFGFDDPIAPPVALDQAARQGVDTSSSSTAILGEVSGGATTAIASESVQAAETAASATFNQAEPVVTSPKAEQPSAPDQSEMTATSETAQQAQPQIGSVQENQSSTNQHVSQEAQPPTRSSREDAQDNQELPLPITSQDILKSTQMHGTMASTQRIEITRLPPGPRPPSETMVVSEAPLPEGTHRVVTTTRPRSSAHTAEEVLRAELERAGISVPPGHDAHHVVPKEGGGRWGARAQNILREVGIGINEECNGVPLPSTSLDPRTIPEAVIRHGPIHTTRYFKELAKRLGPVQGDPAAIRNVLRLIRQEIIDGKFPH